MPEINFQSLIDAISENVAIVDETGNIVHVNNAWLKFGAENAGQNVLINTGANYFTPVYQAAQAGDLYAQKITTGIQDLIANKISSFELEYPCHSDTEQRWFIVNIEEIGASDPRLFLFTHKNVSNLVTREENVLEAQRLEAVGQLSGGIAHDFNNLLGIIMGNIELARNNTGDHALVNDYLDSSLDAIRRGASLVQRLLSFAREQNLKLEKINLNRLIDSTFNLIHPVIGEDIKIITQLDDQDLTVEVDSNMLSSAIVNIAINARQAMPEGGVLTIRSSHQQVDGALFLSSQEPVSGRYALITISDTGTGIKDEYLNKVFEPFFTTKDIGQGSGLGLSMVFGFMKQSNGYIHITSQPGKGTNVFLYLPVQNINTTEPRSVEEAAQNTGAAKTILLVEDNEGILNTLTKMLNSLGHEVIQTHDGKQALEKLTRQADNIDVVLSDIIMPSAITGIELAQEITQTYPKIKILLMSGYPHNKFMTDDIMLQVPILEKPFSLNTLADAIQTLT